MSAIKDLLHRTMEALERGDYATVLTHLEPWQDEAPLQLWAIVQFMAETQGND